MNAYPAELIRAIERLYDDPSVPFGMLGVFRELPDDWYEEPKERSVPVMDRLRDLQSLFVSWLCNMANEDEEYEDEEERKRLQREGIGIILALRELRSHVPELEHDPVAH